MNIEIAHSEDLDPLNDNLWEFSCNGYGLLSQFPNVSKESLYVVVSGIRCNAYLFKTVEYYLICLDLITGREKWRQPIPCGLSSDSGLIIDNQNMLLLINRLDGYLYSYHLETGNLIWKFKGPDLGFMLSRKANNVISNCRFKISTLGFILSNKEDLKQKFFSIVDQLSFQESYFLSNVYSEPIIFQDKVIAGCANGYLYALNILSGSLIWKSKLCDSSLHIGLYPVLLDNQLFVFRESSMILFSINPENGKEIWKYSPASYHSYSKNPKLYRNPNTLSNESKFPEYIYLETACQIIWALLGNE